MTTANHPAVREFDFSSPLLYNPVYIPLFHNRSRFLHLFGSAGSGKSVFACQKEIVLSFDGMRKGKRTLIVRRYENTLSGSIYFELKRIIEDWGLSDCFHFLKSPLLIQNKVSGVEFIFRGLDDVEKLKSISGIDRILVEEATEVDQLSDLDQLDIRLRGARSPQITLCYNPVNVHHWLNTEIHQKRPLYHHILKTTYKDNVRLQEFEARLRARELRDGVEPSPTYGEILESKRLTNPNYYAIYGEGNWGSKPEGLIYPDYLIAPTMPRVDFYGLDFGYNEPCALTEGAVIDEPGKPKKQYYVNEVLYETRHTSDSLANRFDALGIKKTVPMYADCARPEMIESLRKRGYWVMPSEKGKGSVKAGIDLVKTYDLLLVAGGKNLFKEVSNYSWKSKDGVWLDEPIDDFNHLCDAFRYGANGKPLRASSGSIYD